MVNRKLSILIYHRVMNESDPLQPSIPNAVQFLGRMRWLARVFNVVSLDEAMQHLREGTLPPRAVAITFDDGYADNHDVALPVLQRLGIRATFFVASGFLDGGRMWNDTVIEVVRRFRGETFSFEPLEIEALPLGGPERRRKAIDLLLARLKHRAFSERQALVDELAASIDQPLDSPMMTSQQVRALSAGGMTVGAHTRWHPILKVLPDHEARHEIESSKHDLESLLGEPVDLFAYPNGKPGQDYTQAHVEMVRSAGFSSAVSTEWGAASATCDRYQLPRFTPWDRSTPKFIARLAWSRGLSLIGTPGEATAQ